MCIWQKNNSKTPEKGNNALFHIRRQLLRQYVVHAMFALIRLVKRSFVRSKHNLFISIYNDFRLNLCKTIDIRFESTSSVICQTNRKHVDSNFF